MSSVSFAINTSGRKELACPVYRLNSFKGRACATGRISRRLKKFALRSTSRRTPPNVKDPGLIQGWISSHRFATWRQRLSPLRIAQNLQRPLLDLPNTLARNRKHLAEFLESVIALFLDTEAFTQHGFLRSEEHTSELQSRPHLV